MPYDVVQAASRRAVLQVDEECTDLPNNCRITMIAEAARKEVLDLGWQVGYDVSITTYRKGNAMRKTLLLALPLTFMGVGTASAHELPPCPEVYYDGVLPEDGGTGPIWSTPDGLPPTYDCDGPGHTHLPSDAPTEIVNPDLPEAPEVAPEVLELPAPIIAPPALPAASGTAQVQEVEVEVMEVAPAMTRPAYFRIGGLIDLL